MSALRERKQSAPAVWQWFVYYCWAMACLYLFAIAVGLWLWTDETEDTQLLAAIYVVAGLVFLIPFAAGPFLPRKPWAWTFGMVLICIGMTSVCCMAASIPLLISWIKDGTKAWFGMGEPVETAPAPGGRSRREY